MPRDLLVDVELRRGRLRRTLQEVLRCAIQDGRLGSGTTLPSSRTLAGDLGVSRGVVTDVYDQLQAEGYVELRARRAPVVIAVARATASASDPPAPIWRYDFVATTPDVDLFPRRAWIRFLERSLRTAPPAVFDYGDHRGRIELRRAIRDYLARVRGVRTEPERIVITQGFTQALDLLCRVLIDRGAKTIAFETPSLPDAWATARMSGLNVVGCPVDRNGLDVDQLRSLNPDAVVTTPAHQFPTGAVMTPDRRRHLIAWAESAGHVIVEDDYDAEFRYDRLGVGAVQGLDPDHVIHVGTASKTLAPAIRLAWMSLPGHLIDDIRKAKGTADSGSPALDQLVLADLVASGEYDRHIGLARRTYRQRRDRLVTSLAEALPEVRVFGADAGLHVVLDLPDDFDDVALANEAARHGIAIRALSPMTLGGIRRQGLLLGYGKLAVERVRDAVFALAAILKPRLR
jgi:GntR family transcriptional regulator / MocR family aminotransferase